MSLRTNLSQNDLHRSFWSLHIVEGLRTLHLTVRGRHSKSFRPHRVSVLWAIWPAHCLLSLVIPRAMTVSWQAGNGCEWRRNGLFGEPWGIPVSSSGHLSVDMMMTIDSGTYQRVTTKTAPTYSLPLPCSNLKGLSESSSKADTLSLPRLRNLPRTR